MVALLRERDFGLVWLAGLISQLGRHAFELALTVHVYQLTGSALAAGAAWGRVTCPVCCSARWPGCLLIAGTASR